MTHRRSSKPGPGRDFRALAADPPQGRHSITCHVERDDDAADVELRVRVNSEGARYALLTAAHRFTDAGAVRALADRLYAAADALEGSDS